MTLEAYAHQELPFERLVEELVPERDLARNPLFQVLFVFQNVPWTGLELGAVKMLPFDVDNGAAQFEMSLMLEETSSGMVGSIAYNTDLFDAATMARFSRLFEKLLDAVVQQPLATVAELKSMLAEETRKEQVEREKQFAQSSRLRLAQARRKPVVTEMREAAL